MEYFRLYPELLYLAVTVLGLLVGSFLNVVIYRLPVMMERGWRRECRELLHPEEPLPQGEHFTLSTPPSHCPRCKHAIRPWENVPLLSWLIQKGRCRHCGEAIPVRYPLVEGITGLLCLVLAIKLGPTWQLAFALLLTWGLIALTIIDFDHQLLPDDITLPLLWLGLALSLKGLFVPVQDALIGAMANRRDIPMES